MIHALLNRYCLLAGTLVLLLTGCASTTGFNMEGVTINKTPDQLIRDFDLHKNTVVLLGGTIVNSTNIKAGTQLEVLAYPLDSGHAPIADTPTSGRFIVLYRGYLETLEYAPGRDVSITGILTQKVEGKIGEVDYTYPFLESKQIHLWEKGHNEELDGHLHFGIGIMFRK